MARFVSLVARVDFEHEGRRWTAGSHLEVPAIQAVVLLHQHKVRFAPGRPPVATPEAAAEAVESSPPPRRRYRRRDLTPDS